MLNMQMSPERLREELERQRMAQSQAGNVTPEQGLMSRLGMPVVSNPSLFPYEGATEARLQPPLTGAEANFMRARNQELAAQAAPLAQRNMPPKPTFMNRVGAAIGDRLRDPAWRARAAAAMNNMTLNPNTAFQTAMLNRSQGIVDSRLKAQETQRVGNATVQYLRSKNMNDLAALVEKEPALGTAVMSYLLRDPKQAPAELQMFTMWRAENPNGTFNEYLKLRKQGMTIDMRESSVKNLGDYFKGYFEKMDSAVAMNTTLDFIGQIAAGTATGPLAQRETAVRRFAASLGVPVDEEKLGNAETLQGYTNFLVADELRQNKGPQTDFDNKFAQTYLPNLGDTPDAFRQKMDYIRSRNLRDILLGDYANAQFSYGDNSKADTEVMRELRSISGKMPAVTMVQSSDGSMQYVTLAAFYDQHRLEGMSNTEIMRKWLQVTAKDFD